MDGRDITLILGTILIGKMRKKKIYPCDISCTITPTYIHEEASNFHGASRFQYPGAGWFRNLRQCTPVFLHRNGPVDRNQWGYHRLLSLVKHSRATENRFQHLVLSTQVRGYRLHIRYPCSPLPTYHFPPFAPLFPSVGTVRESAPSPERREKGNRLTTNNNHRRRRRRRLQLLFKASFSRIAGSRIGGARFKFK